jgi:hypothetical protein
MATVLLDFVPLQRRNGTKPFISCSFVVALTKVLGGRGYIAPNGTVFTNLNSIHYEREYTKISWEESKYLGRNSNPEPLKYDELIEEWCLLGCYAVKTSNLTKN